MSKLSKKTKVVISLVLVTVMVFAGMSTALVMANQEEITLGSSSLDLGESSTEEKPDVSPNLLTLGKSAQPLAAPYAMGDIIATLSSDQQAYQSYTDDNNGTVPPQLAINVKVQVNNASPAGGDRIEIKPELLSGYLSVPYFSFAGIDSVATSPVFESAEIIGGKVIITIKKDATKNSDVNLFVYYNFASKNVGGTTVYDYDGGVVDKTKMANFAVEVFSGGVSIANNPTFEVNAAATNHRTYSLTNNMPGLTNAAGTDKYTAELVNGDPVTSGDHRISNNYYYKNRHDPDNPPVYYAFLPVGSKFESYTLGSVISTGVVVADGEHPGIPAGTYDVLTRPLSAVDKD